MDAGMEAFYQIGGMQYRMGYGGRILGENRGRHLKEAQNYQEARGKNRTTGDSKLGRRRRGEI